MEFWNVTGATSENGGQYVKPISFAAPSQADKLLPQVAQWTAFCRLRVSLKFAVKFVDELLRLEV